MAVRADTVLTGHYATLTAIAHLYMWHSSILVPMLFFATDTGALFVYNALWLMVHSSWMLLQQYIGLGLSLSLDNQVKTCLLLLVTQPVQSVACTYAALQSATNIHRLTGKCVVNLRNLT